MTTAGTDPREGLPSASGLDLIVACPGSWLAQKDLPPLPPDTDRTDGSEMHAAFAGEVDIESLDSATKQATVSAAERIRDRIFKQYATGTEKDVIHIESRYWLHDLRGQRCFSGQVDWAMITPKGLALILDFKSLFGDYACDSSWQLLGQACAFYQTMKREGVIVDEILCGFIQPRVTMEPKMVRYSRVDLEASIDIILRHLHAAHLKDSPRYPGAHCGKCAAAGVCLEAQSLTAMVGFNSALPAINRLTPQQIATILPRLPLIEKLCEQIRARAKQAALEQEGAIPGYEIKYVEARQVITDINGLFGEIKDVVGKDDYRALLNLPVTAVRELFCDRWSRAHNTTLKAAAEVFDERVKAHSLRGPKQPRLQRKKGTQ